MKIYIRNRQRLVKVNQRRIESRLRKALRLLRLPRAELSILLVNDGRMRILNRQYRNIDRTTDVLSFPQMKEISNLESQICLLGDIVINLHRAKRQAAEHGLTMDEELKRLLIHGLLHLIGFDHEKGRHAERKMKKKTRELLELLDP